MKVANIHREILHSYWTNATYDNIKSHKKNQGFNSLRYIFWKITEGEGGQIDPPAVLGLKFSKIFDNKTFVSI